ncbi:MAG TPA: NAD(P)/FAD-dependent oxidoreductase [Polyangiaceae bacterium]
MVWRQRVVIVGAGFAGLTAARALRNERLEILLLDRNNHHLFQPLLYQVATCALSPSEIAMPIRTIVRGQKNIEVLYSEVRSVNLAARCLETSTGPVDYHFLILATGVRNNYFGHDDWAQSATGLKTLDDALEIRRRVLLALEVAEQETLDERRRQLLTFCVIGGGPTGVELAGALSELSRTMARRDFRHINPGEISIVLVEGSPHLLSAFAPPMQESAIAQLIELGVEVRRNARVVRIDASGVVVHDEQGNEVLIGASTVLWGAGVRGSPLAETLGVPLDRGGRVIVGESLNVPGYDEVFCVGDMAACTDTDGTMVPGVAPAAMQQGNFVATAIIGRVHNQPKELKFRYVDKGKLATIGRSAAVAELKGMKLSGFVAWVLWLCVHICFLVGFRNRYLVLCQWVWHYFTFQGGARLITGSRDLRISWPTQPRRLAISRPSREPAPIES